MKRNENTKEKAQTAGSKTKTHEQKPKPNKVNRQ